MVHDNPDESKKVLLIQSDSAIGPILQRVLEKAGHDVVLANTSRDELAPSIESAPSLVITDFMSAKTKDRIDTIKHVHDAAPQAKIIALFSGDEENQAERLAVAKEPGVFRVVNDPFEVGSLLDAMRKAIDTRS